MARKRSYNELEELRDRIDKRMIRSGNYSGLTLTARAAAQAFRYQGNIAKSKTGRAASARFKAAVEAGDYAKRDQIRDSILNRKFSPNTYKGMANG